jgi:hypothetical protein
MQKVFLLFIAGKSNMTSPAIAAIDARCGFFVRAIVGSRDMRPDPDESSDDSKLAGLWMILGRVIKYLIEWLIGWRRALQAL